MTTRVGFIGVGSQGGPMARRIVDRGFPLALWARRPESLDPFAGTGAVIAPSPAELGARADVVGICVVADADVESVVLGEEGVLQGMGPGGVVVIHSTVHPETCRRMAGEARPRGIGVVDAPVSGGGRAAAEGRLLVMVGGDEGPVETARPVLEAFGDPVVHLGPLGSGQRAKLLNNLAFTAQLAVALETFGLARDLGIDEGAFADVLARGSGGSQAAAILGSTGFDLDPLRSAASLLRKDVELALSLVEEAGAARPQHLVTLSQATLEVLKGDPA